MADEVVKFDPSTLMQGVKDRIKSTFVSLIPDDQWEIMVKKEIDAFFEHGTSYSKKVTVNNYDNNYGYGRNNYSTNVEVTGSTSAFRALIFEMCMDKCIHFVKHQMTEEHLKTAINKETNKHEYNEGFKMILEEALPMAITNFMRGMAMHYTNQLRSDIQNHR